MLLWFLFSGLSEAFWWGWEWFLACVQRALTVGSSEDKPCAFSHPTDKHAHRCWLQILAAFRRREHPDRKWHRGGRAHQAHNCRSQSIILPKSTQERKLQVSSCVQPRAENYATLLACSRLTFLYSSEKWWLFYPQLTRKSLTDIPTGQPTLDNSTLSLSSQIFLDWVKLAVNNNQHTRHYHFIIQFPDIPEKLTMAVIWAVWVHPCLSGLL